MADEKALVKAKPRKISASVTMPKEVQRAVTDAVETLVLPANEKGVLLPLTDANYEAASKAYLAAKAINKKWTDFFEGLRKPFNDAKNNVIAEERTFLKPLRDGLALVGKLIDDYQKEQDRKAQEAARIAREESERLAREQRQRELDALKAAAANTPSEAAREALTETATSLQSAPLSFRPLPVPAPATPAKLVKTRETWEAEVVDFERLVIACAGPVFRKLAAAAGNPTASQVLLSVADWLSNEVGEGDLAYLSPNMTELNTIIRRCEGVSPVPGVRGVSKNALNRNAPATLTTSPPPRDPGEEMSF